MLEKLKKDVLEANLELEKKGLVIYTWGNVSALDKQTNLVVIKPSGVDYSVMQASDMVVVDLEGNIIEGNLKPSSDTPTHLEIYKNFDNVYSVVHTHSKWATIWSQSGHDLPAYGTTHADYFYGNIPNTRKMTKLEIQDNYEKNTGTIIVETFKARNIDPQYIGAVLVNSHGPFVWGKDVKDSVFNAVVLEEIAQMAYFSNSIEPNLSDLDNNILNKHFLRKHGANAYYGQKH